MQIDPYQGAKRSLDTTKGLGYGVVKNLVSVLPANQPFHITFDNFFTTFDLMRCLTEEGIGATGTVRKNRLRDYPVDIKKLKLEERGSFDYRLEEESGIIACSWNDNNVVTVMSNKHPWSSSFEKS